MSLGEAIRLTRQKAFYTQEDFAKELNVAISTINRWELNKVKPNMKAMKSISCFCRNNSLPFEDIEKEWLRIKSEDDKND